MGSVLGVGSGGCFAFVAISSQARIMGSICRSDTPGSFCDGDCFVGRRFDVDVSRRHQARAEVNGLARTTEDFKRGIEKFLKKT